MFIVDKVVEEDQRMLLSNEFESVTLQALGSGTRDDAFVISKYAR